MKTTMNKTVFAVCIGFLSIPIPLLFTACEIFEPYDKIYYHDVGGEGYVYYDDKPLSNVKIRVLSEFEHKGYATKLPIDEFFASDENGFFQVRFIKRTGHSNVIEHSISLSGNDTLVYNNGSAGLRVIYLAELRNAKENIQLGIFNLKK